MSPHACVRKAKESDAGAIPALRLAFFAEADTLQAGK